MGQLSAKLRNYGDDGLMFFCPGCKLAHAVNSRWTFDGNAAAPTFSPSIRTFTRYAADGSPLPDGQDRTLCHSFVRAGRIEFLGDCTHALAGQTVDLPDLPDWLRDDDG